MLRKLRTALVLALALGFAGSVLAASPTPHQIYEAARAGHLDEAQTMMNQVLKEHPQSGEAHYVAAELYAREGNFSSARSELATAETLAPGLPFAKPESVQRLQRELAQGPAMRMAPRYEQRGAQVHSIPWGPILLLVGAIAVVWAVIRRRSAAAVYQQYGGGPVVAGGAPPGYGPGPVYGPGYGGGAPGMGSTIAGGLASGLAVGAGVVAGEELAHRFLDGNREGGVVPRDDYQPPNPNADMGGNDFGVNDGSSWDDGGSVGDVGGGSDDWT